MYLLERVENLLAETADAVSGYKELAGLYNEIVELKSRIHKPLRVAVIGLIKAGKSTLINAILQKNMLITGNLETTYTVSWFRYSDTPGIVIHFRDGRTKTGRMEDIYNWTVRDTSGNNMEIDQVEYVEILDNNEILKYLEIIDTPGLASTYGIDSENTTDFLGISTELTVKEASKADAIIYAFSKAIGENDDDVLSAFQNSFTNASPINAFGVLTKVDSYWQGEDHNPFAEANRIVDKYKNDPYLKTRLYTILPVCAKASGSGVSLTVKEYELLHRLSRVSEERLQKLLKNAMRFCEREFDDVLVSACDRNHIYNKLDLYGTHLAIKCIKEGMSLEELTPFLYDYSGVQDIGKLIQNHFGRRSTIIKISYIISRVKDRCFQFLSMSDSENTVQRQLVEYILNEFQQLEDNELCFHELKLLQFYYNGELELSQKEEEEFFRMTGEMGNRFEDRVKCSGLNINELTNLVKEKADYWNTCANLRYGSAAYIEMSRTLGRTYETMYYYLIKLSI